MGEARRLPVQESGYEHGKVLVAGNRTAAAPEKLKGQTALGPRSVQACRANTAQS
jgi:hypothetical protein